jgi:hypothetical protein
MISRFEIMTKGSPRPEAEAIVFCDGTGGGWYRPETDLELSHWRPNRTPTEYRAGTSTEICYKFLDSPHTGSWTVAVNNHVDVDGILSVYALVHSEYALRHRQTLIEAAEIGDFWEWGDQPAQRVFQGLTQIMQDGEGQAVYEEAFRRIPGLVEGSDPACDQIEEGLLPLQLGVDLVEQGGIARTQLSERLTHYVIPASVVGSNLDAALYTPGFNEAVSSKMLLWPQVRAKWDRERVCLVSVEGHGGWYHGLWFPGYLWADTEGRWRVPGMSYPRGMEDYELNHSPLANAFAALQEQETNKRNWIFGSTELGDLFPLVGKFAKEDGGWAASGISPQQLADEMQGVFWCATTSNLSY